MRFSPVTIVFVPYSAALSALLIVRGFHSGLNLNTSHPRGKLSIMSNRKRFFGSHAYATTTSTSLNLTGDIRDPDVLLKIVEGLAVEDFTPETMAKMKKVETALGNFMEETRAALLKQEKYTQNHEQLKPSPPSIPPPRNLFGMEDLRRERELPWWQHQDRDLVTDLAHAGSALEFLQERLREEEEALLKAERTFQLESRDDSQDTLAGGNDILSEAEHVLRKSREAAEKRRVKADRRRVTAARISAEYQWQQVQAHEQEKQEQEVGQSVTENLFAASQSREINDSRLSEEEDSSNDIPRTQKRPTMELRGLFGKHRSIEGIINETPAAKSNSEFPEDVPIIYNWVQDEDGCITGNIRGSITYYDGAKISTSSISEVACGGTTVATESGSRYFLEKITTGAEDIEGDNYHNEFSIQSLMPTVDPPKAPDDVPTIKSWELHHSGGIIGLIYGCSYADDGDYIETSPIVDGDIDNFSVVSTSSGSRYFLSGDSNPSHNLSTFQDVRIPNRSTITLSSISPPGEERQTRPTFSLFDLFDDVSERISNGPLNFHQSQTHQLSQPSSDNMPLASTPTLTDWVFNANGSITGYIFGSTRIGDGVLITTSPIVDGEKKQFETVRSASGSLYYLT